VACPWALGGALFYQSDVNCDNGILSSCSTGEIKFGQNSVSQPRNAQDAAISEGGVAMLVRGVTVFLAFFFALVLLIGGRNMGLGVNSAPLPLPGLMAVTLGLSIWCASSRLAKSFPWFPTFLVASYVGLVVLAAQAFVGAYDNSGGLSDSSLDAFSKSHLRATVTFNIGFGFLSSLSVFALRFATRKADSKGHSS
jgi:hypothetical protein